MARASTHTLLSLDRYAAILGINPAHFNGLAGAAIMPVSGQCTDVWHQYAWQAHDSVSREDLARAIADAEQEIASVIGFDPAPRWISQEIYRYPLPYHPDAYDWGYNARGQFKSIQARGHFIQAGRRATTLVGTATTVGGTLVYSDPDGDGFDELATVTLATTLTDACEIKAYFAGHSAEQEWEIRSAKSVTISGGNVVLTFDSWLLVDPDLWEVLPTTVDDEGAINIMVSGNFVTSVEVYREYTDFTQAGAEFSWEPKPKNLTFTYCTSCGGAGCPACSNTTQDGCLHVRDVNLGIVVPKPATYDSDNAIWVEDAWTECRAPDTVKLWYYAGDLSNKYLSGRTCDPLSDWFAHAIAWLATARLERNFCDCGNTLNLQDQWRFDLARADTTASYNLTAEILENPFGTKRGEIMAWQRIGQLSPMIAEVALI